MHQTNNTPALEADNTQVSEEPVRKVLSQDDIQRLLKDPSADGKIAVLSKITTMYNEQDESLSLDKKESAIVEDIFRVLMKTAETKVRAALSESVKSSDSLPKDIALSIARDIDEVALPVLQCSQVLDESDLKEIIQNSMSSAQLEAIAKRDEISESLSFELVKKDAKIADTLLNNTGAQVGAQAYEHLMTGDTLSDTMIRSMVEKGAIPVSVLEKMLASANTAIRKELDQKYHVVLEDKELKKEMENKLRAATKRMVGARANEAQRKQLLRELADSGRIGVFTGLTTGNYALFETDMARMARISLNNVRVLLNDPGNNGLRALYKAAKLPNSLFEATAVMVQTLQMLEAEYLEKNKGMRGSFSPSEIIQRLYTVVGERKVENIDVFISMIEGGRKRIY